jgi:hypothetical protein
MSGRFGRTPGNESSLPERLRAAGGTDRERRVLEAAAGEQPSRELCERMALAIGVSPPPAAPVEQGIPDLASLAPKAAVGSRALLPWVSATVVVAIAGAIVVTRPNVSSPSSVHSASLPVQAPASATLPAVSPTGMPGASETEASPSIASASSAPRSRPTASVADIQGQIALVDAARAALSAGASERALVLSRQYQSKYPAGSFRPEAAALKIEALAKLGRSAEARALAQRFVTEYGSSPLADRVARVTGIGRP